MMMMRVASVLICLNWPTSDWDYSFIFRRFPVCQPASQLVSQPPSVRPQNLIINAYKNPGPGLSNWLTRLIEASLAWRRVKLQPISICMHSSHFACISWSLQKVHTYRESPGENTGQVTLWCRGLTCELCVSATLSQKPSAKKHKSSWQKSVNLLFIYAVSPNNSSCFCLRFGVFAKGIVLWSCQVGLAEKRAKAGRRLLVFLYTFDLE